MKPRFLLSFILAFVLTHVSAQQLTLVGGRTNYAVDESVSVAYEGATNGDVIKLYHNQSMLPLAERLTVNSESGVYEVASVLHPGSYHVLLESGDGAVKSEVDFKIGEYPLPAGKRIFVISDPHVMSPYLVEDPTFYRYLNTMGDDKKLLPQSYEILQACMDSIRAYQPDLVIIPGDLTREGEALSHNLVAGSLQELLEEGFPTLVIPGNHDMENHMARYFTTNDVVEADFVMPDEFVELYRNFGWDERSERDPNSLTYARDIFDGVRFIGIDDCRIISRGDVNREDGEYGRILPKTLEWVLTQIDSAVADGKVVIVAIHHQMLQHYNGQGQLMASAATENGESIARLFADHGVRLVLTGHMHQPNISRIRGFETEGILTEVSSASTVTYPSQFRLLTLSDDLAEVSVDTRYIHRIPSFDNLQLAARDKVGVTLGKTMENLVPRYMSTFNSMMKQLSSIPEFANIVKDVPDDTDELAALATQAFGETMKKVIFTTSEGNENLKNAADEILAQLKVDCNTLSDLVFDNQNAATRAFLAQSLYYYMLDNVEDIFKSMLSDTSYLGTDLADQTDDLYVIIRLKDADQGIGSPHITRQEGTQVYSITGMAMPEGVSRLSKGIYVVRKDGKSRKVVVR